MWAALGSPGHHSFHSVGRMLGDLCWHLLNVWYRICVPRSWHTESAQLNTVFYYHYFFFQSSESPHEVDILFSFYRWEQEVRQCSHVIQLMCAEKDANLCAPIHQGEFCGTDSNLNSKLCSSTASNTSNGLKFRYVVKRSFKQGWEILSLFWVVGVQQQIQGKWKRRENG